VVLTLATPFEPFMLMFDATACAIVPKHIYDGTDYRTNPANPEADRHRAVPVRRVAARQFHPHEALRRLLGGGPALSRRNHLPRIIPDSQSRALALQTGQVQLTQANDIEPFDVPRFRALPNLEVELNGWEYASQLSWIEINHRVKPLGDVRVRQAINLAIDRNFIREPAVVRHRQAGDGPDLLDHQILRSRGGQACRGTIRRPRYSCSTPPG